MRILAGLTFVTLTLLSTVPGQTKTGTLKARPNVILITVDTLRADHVGAYGGKVPTPAIDSLAKDSVLFENAISQVPLTLPSHASMLTGTYPFHNGVQDFTGQPLDPRFRTLAEAFKANGYVTTAVVSSFVLDRSWGLAKGFDHYQDAFAPESFLTKHIALVERRGDQSVDKALEWLSRRPITKPFFLWLHLFDPHSPYDPPEPFRSRFKGSPYAGEVAYTDKQIERFLGLLKAQRLYQQSAIVLLSDHGESLGEHGEQEHGFFVYRSTTHVPLLLKAPASRKLTGRRVTQAVETMALGPTLLELAGIRDPIQKQFQTSSWLESTRKEDLEATAYSESFYPLSSFAWSPLRSIQTSRLHYIDAPKPELYEFDDSSRNVDVIAQRPAVASSFRERLQKLSRKFALTSEPQKSTGAPADAAEKLRALGYVSQRAPVSAEALAKGLPDPKDKIGEFNAIMLAGDAFARGDMERGRTLLEQVRKSEPELYVVPFMLGEALLRQQDWSGAKVELQRAVDLNPTFDQALTALAQAQFRLGERDKAKVQVNRAIEINPQNYRAWYLLSFIEGSADPQNAITPLKKVLEIQPNFTLAHRDLGMIASQRGDYKESLRHLSRAIKLGIDDKIIRNMLGIAASQQRDYPLAVKHLGRALAMDPDFAEAHLNIALAYQRMGRAAAAQKAYENACRLRQAFCKFVPH